MIYLLLLMVFFIAIFLYLNHYYYIYYPSSEILSAYINERRYDRLEEKGFLTDKYLVKDYINENFKDIKVAKTLFRTTDPEELRSFDFPEKYVVKYTSGSQMNIIVNDGQYPIDKLIRKCRKFMNNKFSTSQYRFIPGFEEPHYNYNTPSIIIEEYLGKSIDDYKFYCVKDKVAFILVDRDRFVYHKKNIYDQDMNLLKDNMVGAINFTEELNISKENIDKMKDFCIEFYKQKSFDFVRIDFYIIDNEVYFGEFTFTPFNCSVRFTGDFDKQMYQKYVK